MSSIATAMVVFACVSAGALVGLLLRTWLPEQHLTDATKDVTRLATGLIATMTALVLGLMTASAKSSYDAQDEAVKHLAVNVLLLDRALANYGPETADARALLRRVLEERMQTVWTERRFERAKLDTPQVAVAGHEIESALLRLSPGNDAQRWLRSQALQIVGEISQTRWFILGELGAMANSTPFLVVIVFWLVLIFASFALFAPRNGTVIVTLGLSAVSAAAAIFLILEMSHPFEGLMRLSGEPLRYALSHLGE